MSHNNAVVTSGTLRVVLDPRFPPHELFEPGIEHLCRLRHASASDDDDTVIQVRAASLKLVDSGVPATRPESAVSMVPPGASRPPIASLLIARFCS